MQTSKAIGLAFLSLSLGLGSVVACSGTPRNAVFDDAGTEGGTLPTGDEAGALFEDAAPQEDLSPRGTWTGTVYTPAGDIPVAGALVYLTPKKPDARPLTNFCDTCVPLEKSIPQTLSKADGTFELVANRLGKQFMVIQKGQFRRVVEVDIKQGDIRVSRSDSTLPRQNDTARGDQVPSVLIIDTDYDDIENALDKLGIPRGTVVKDDDRMNEFRDPAKLDKYQIIFLPCGECGTSNGGNGIFNPPSSHGQGHAMDATVQANLKAWVQKGGKLYVTDFAYSFLNETWKDYVRFAPSKGCESNSYDTPGQHRRSRPQGLARRAGRSQRHVRERVDQGRGRERGHRAGRRGRHEKGRPQGVGLRERQWQKPPHDALVRGRVRPRALQRVPHRG